MNPWFCCSRRRVCLRSRKILATGLPLRLQLGPSQSGCLNAELWSLFLGVEFVRALMMLASTIRLPRHFQPQLLRDTERINQSERAQVPPDDCGGFNIFMSSNVALEICRWWFRPCAGGTRFPLPKSDSDWNSREAQTHRSWLSRDETGQVLVGSAGCGKGR